MKAASFEYHAPVSIDEALSSLHELGDEAKLLGGGQSLIPVLAMRLTRFDHLIDLNGISDLNYIHFTEQAVTIGAMTRQATAEHSSVVTNNVPLLAKAIPAIGHFQIRNRGTICGSIAHGDPASELPAVASVLGATMHLESKDEKRDVAAADFFLSTWETAIEPNEMLSSVSFPIWKGRVGTGFEEFAMRHGDFALTGVMCAIKLDAANMVERAGISLMGMDAAPFKARQTEEALLGTSIDDIDLNAVVATAVGEANPSDDLHGSAQYRKQVCSVLLRRALGSAIEEALHA